MESKEECKDCNKSLDGCTCIEDTIELKEAAENHAKIFQFPFDCDPAETFIEGAKWQQERMYSEEDMKFAYEQGARLALLSQTDLARHKGEFPNPEEWFNEFKKI